MEVDGVSNMLGIVDVKQQIKWERRSYGDRLGSHLNSAMLY